MFTQQYEIGARVITEEREEGVITDFDAETGLYGIVINGEEYAIDPGYIVGRAGNE